MRINKKEKKVDRMEKYKYNNAIIYIRGKVNRERLEKATIRFMRNADRCTKTKGKEKNNGDEHTSRNIGA